MRSSLASARGRAADILPTTKHVTIQPYARESGTDLGITELLLNILTLYSFVLFGRAIFSWFDPGFRTPVGRILYDLTEPVVAPIRQLLPSMGGLDLSIMVAIFLIIILQRLLASAI